MADAIAAAWDSSSTAPFKQEERPARPGNGIRALTARPHAQLRREPQLLDEPADLDDALDGARMSVKACPSRRACSCSTTSSRRPAEQRNSSSRRSSTIRANPASCSPPLSSAAHRPWPRRARRPARRAPNRARDTDRCASDPALGCDWTPAPPNLPATRRSRFVMWPTALASDQGLGGGPRGCPTARHAIHRA
jgi:hypothetical protein